MGQFNRLPILLLSSTFFLVLVLHQLTTNTIVEPALSTQHIQLDEGKVSHVKQGPPVNYVVFGSNTPNGESYRSYDYVFNLPLTALAWQRIGFRSVVLIIGSRCEWENDPTLSYILTHLEARLANVIFITSPLEHRSKLSQTGRAFAVNLPEFPGKDNDYLITSDSDLWPLRKEHYVRPRHMDVVLVHSKCCGSFQMNNKSYPMYPMSNIGASVSTWRQVMNDNHSIAYDAETILDYLEHVFGEMSRGPLVVGKETWYMDQRVTSIRLTEWMDKHGDSSVHRVSDDGFSRVDRNSWDAATMSRENFTLKFDAHLPVKIYLPVNWNNIRPLINLMYGKESWQAKWCDEYASEFLKKVTNYLNFGTVG